MGTTNIKMDLSSANFYVAVRQNPLIRFEHLLDPMEIQSKSFNAITSDVAIFTNIKSFSYHMLNDSQKPNATYAIRRQQKITK